MGLLGKLLLPILIGVFGFAIVIHFYWGESLQNDKQETIIAQEIRVLKTLEPGLIRALLAGDLAALHSGLSHTHRTHKNRWKQVVLSNQNGVQIYPIKKTTPLGNNNYITLSHLLLVDNESVGNIQLTIDVTQDLQIEKQRIFNLELITLLLFAVIGLVSAFWQNAVIRKPILRLEKAASRLADGDYKIKLPHKGNDEISNLTAAFNTMGEELWRTTDSLQELVQTSRANEVRISTVLNNIADGIITTDETGIIESFTLAASKIFGYTEEEVKGKNITLLMPVTYKKAHSEGLQQYIKNNNKTIIDNRVEVEGQRKNGDIFPLELSINEMKIGNQRLFSGIARDITKHKRTEKLKNEFVSTVSHELRTPLTSISGSLRLIIGGALGDIPSQVKEMLIIANNNTDRLLLLINDILDMQKIEAGNMTFVPCIMEVEPLIKQAVEVNQAYAEQFSINLKIINNQKNIQINADSARLIQVLYNLISNAVKFSPTGSTVELNSIAMDGHINISVIDHGTGIPTSFHNKLFEKFTQADSSNTRKTGSTGLGLSISKAIIEKHEGEIGFSTEEGAGSCFWFKLPIVPHKKKT
ncbi:Osmosensitive K+ channel histidine kinase KdpD [hydrothermal vent metagenome]|uniref:histidine kinase n=1 Tax=hydrothermal vent metagenome TaxID=652676 RepID=A0A3B0ZJN8_9ZZZZ